MGRVAPLVGISLLLAPASAAADGRPPAWLVTTEWGFTAEPYHDELLASDEVGLGGAGGVKLALRHRLGFLELEALPLWTHAYSARAGTIFGKRSRWGHINWAPDSGGSVSPRRIETETGLEVAISAHWLPGGEVGGDAAVYLEAGIGSLGQNLFEVLAIYDVVNGAPGTRLNMLFGMGDKKVSLAFGIRCEMLYDFDDHPMPILCTFGVGGGRGFGD